MQQIWIKSQFALSLAPPNSAQAGFIEMTNYNIFFLSSFQKAFYNDEINPFCFLLKTENMSKSSEDPAYVYLYIFPFLGVRGVEGLSYFLNVLHDLKEILPAKNYNI